MKILTIFLVAISLSVLCGCETERKSVPQLAARPADAKGQASKPGAELRGQSAAAGALTTTIGGRAMQVSLDEASAAQAATLAADRKIIRNADLTIETDSQQTAFARSLRSPKATAGSSSHPNSSRMTSVGSRRLRRQ